ncbi:MAG: hypothetical protein ACREMQ_00305 [Longimicrobiales bacterium]
MKQLGMIALSLRALRRRILILLAFTAAFLVAALAARVVTGAHDGHVELDRIFQIGGAPLASAFLLLGWVIGRFPLVAVLVLMAGIFSHDRADGTARLYFARPVSPIAVYGSRFTVLALLAFAISALLMPAFDVILLGQWAGPNTLVLIASYIIAYGGLVAFLSLWTRADSWIALIMGIFAIAWHALRVAGVLEGAAPGVREIVSLILPPHGALFAIETAFAQMLPIPWEAVLVVGLYGTVLLLITALFVGQREI